MRGWINTWGWAERWVWEGLIVSERGMAGVWGRGTLNSSRNRGGGGRALLSPLEGSHLQHQLLMPNILELRLLVQLTDFGLVNRKSIVYGPQRPSFHQFSTFKKNLNQHWNSDNLSTSRQELTNFIIRFRYLLVMRIRVPFQNLKLPATYSRTFNWNNPFSNDSPGEPRSFPSVSSEDQFDIWKIEQERNLNLSRGWGLGGSQQKGIDSLSSSSGGGVGSPLFALAIGACEASEVILVVTQCSQGFSMLSLEVFPLFSRFTELLLQIQQDSE